MIYVFISYSRKDIEFVGRLRINLLAGGIKVWLDREDIPPGLNWDVEIQKTLRGGSITHVLFVQSQSSIASDIVLNELAEAYENKIKYIIPLLLDDCKTPLIVKRRNSVDFRNNYEIALQQLLTTLESQHKGQDTVEDGEIAPQKITRVPSQSQKNAAQDGNKLVRLLAGPGTGKSFVAEERVRWLLEKGISPKNIFVISFTRASSADLRDRIVEYATAHDQKKVTGVSTSTLHSIALKTLRKSGALEKYPTNNPLVLDDWELKYLFDAEFKIKHGGVFVKVDNKAIPKRAEEIRRYFEALWSTGQENPGDYFLPKMPITEEEKSQFEVFHLLFTRTYSCVLPGEIVAKSVELIDKGLLDPVSLLGIKHLIVDEFQDLNNSDIEFIHAIASNDQTNVYVLGDDDQSIYSFRFAYPLGIQSFTDKYPQATSHTLGDCFRCTPQVLGIASSLIAKHALPKRIPKNLKPVYEDVEGIIHQLKFKSEQREGDFIADACKKLIETGVEPNNILVLISSRNTQLTALKKAFEKVDVDIELPTGDRYIDTEQGRYAYAILRVACDLSLQDYVAHRLVLGLPKGIGEKTCIGIREKIASTNLRFLEIFYYDLPQNIFSAREIKAIEVARQTFDKIAAWRDEDTLEEHKDTIAQMISAAFDNEKYGTQWLEEVKELPVEITLKELISYFGVQSQQQRTKVLEEVYERIGQELPEELVSEARVQIMTMHGAKGLNAKVVFIPGLENDIIPGNRGREMPMGVYLEKARLLYVSITRASVACFLSFAKSRRLGGKPEFNRTPSEFLTSLGGRFTDRNENLSDEETEEILNSLKALETAKTQG